MKKSLKNIRRDGILNPSAKPVKIKNKYYPTIKDAMSDLNLSYVKVKKMCIYVTKEEYNENS